VFVTGASRGIGKATVEKFLAEGWNVAGFYRETKGEEKEGLKLYAMDMEDADSVEIAFNQAYSDFGRVDCFVNCAGIFGYQTLQQYDLETMGHVVAVNEVGMYIATKMILQKMEKGSMVFIASTAAQVGSNDPVYAGTKGAVLAFTKSIAKSLAPLIRVNCVAPGVTESDMTKNMNQERLDQLIGMSLLKKIAHPSDIANGIYFLAGDQAAHITGTCLDINGGYVLR
jgi:3-oxoacyl-[acyl-carrier protein] reductase